MDPTHIIQVSLLSKFINEPFNINNPYILLCFIIFMFLKMVPESFYYYIETEINGFFNNKNESSITIPYHIKSYTSFGCNKTFDKILYSDRFRAINYHIKKYHLHKLFSLNEIINFENSRYLECDCDFILLPRDRQKIMIEEKEEIFFEILFEIPRETNDEKNEKTRDKQLTTKKYIYKISKKGEQSIQSLHSFLDKIEKEYLDEIVNKTTQMVFEYKKTVKDEDEGQMTIFTETPFQTNKSFDNIFFEGKSEFIEYISQFCKNTTDEWKEKYKKSGNPFKSIILLHGDPGCGKSSLIKATIKHTGRHCILVPWTKIKTCNDFVSLFRPLKINNKRYSQEELIVVFEDFDANENAVIKIREGLKKEGLKKQKRTDTVQNIESEITNDIIKTKYDSFINTQLIALAKNEDEITLEYILNVLDGIVELYNVIVFFTTNDIDIIDPALKRAGRIDRIIKMELASRSMIKEMIAHHFSLDLYKDMTDTPKKSKHIDIFLKEINKIPEYKISFADISQICNDSKTVEECLERILHLSKNFTL